MRFCIVASWKFTLPLAHCLFAKGGTLWRWANLFASVRSPYLCYSGAVFHWTVRNILNGRLSLCIPTNYFTRIQWRLLTANIALCFFGTLLLAILMILSRAIAFPSARWLASVCNCRRNRFVRSHLWMLWPSDWGSRGRTSIILDDASLRVCVWIASWGLRFVAVFTLLWRFANQVALWFFATAFWDLAIPPTLLVALRHLANRWWALHFALWLRTLQLGISAIFLGTHFAIDFPLTIRFSCIALSLTFLRSTLRVRAINVLTLHSTVLFAPRICALPFTSWFALNRRKHDLLTTPFLCESRRV
mmetsp:Transcript_57328/g.89204  ORF Transcript_57328/g.89204 Transcript_57328/m.89204 type:complete len:304 (-) Transcript_57328:299-1210(-)